MIKEVLNHFMTDRQLSKILLSKNGFKIYRVSSLIALIFMNRMRPFLKSVLLYCIHSVFKAYIPEVEESTNVQFYAVAQDSRLANEYGGGFVLTGYGAAEPVEIFIDDIVGFGNPIVDFFAMAIMMGLMYGVVWGGLYKTVGIATESERRKNEAEDLTNKMPKKKAKPPAKPPDKGNIKKVLPKSVAAIPKDS